jgi:ATP-dependent RNA helicase DeaD
MAGGIDGVKARLEAAGPLEEGLAVEKAIESLVSGADCQVYHTTAATAGRLVAAYVAEVGGPSLVLCSTSEKASTISDTLAGFGAKEVRAITSEESAVSLTDLKSSSQAVVVAPAAMCASVAKKAADQISVQRIIIDNIEEIVGAGNLTELEAILNAVRENNGEAQVVVIAAEPSLHVSALSRRFLNTPVTVTLKAEAQRDAEHVYFEVGNTLLAKPQAMCDLLEAETDARVLVFCNSPADADFADVIIKKRGVQSMKLIGYVPQLKLSKALHQLQKGEVGVVVLTDVAARGVPLEEFDVVVNYSVPTDPEIYFHRYSTSLESRTRKIVSLVSPLDISNFHYVKKLGQLEFVKGSLPSPEEIMGLKLQGLRRQALERDAAEDASMSQLVLSILKDEAADKIITLLLHNTLSVMPALKASMTSTRDSAGDDRGGELDGGYEDEDGGQQPRRNDGRRGDRGDRGGRDRGGRDRDRQGNGRGPGRGRRDDDFVASGDGQRDEDFGQFADSEGGEQPRQRDRRNSRGDRGERGDRGDRGDRRSRQGPVDREVRIYVGQGATQGLTVDRLVSAVVENGVTSDAVKRPQIRKNYSFIDVPEKVADEVVEKLAETEFEGGKFFVRKAVTLSLPRPPQERSSDDDRPEFSHDSEFDSGADSDMGSDVDMSGNGDSESDQGPTLLAVDD